MQLLKKKWSNVLACAETASERPDRGQTHLGTNHSKAEQPLKVLEIVIPMQQGVPVHQTKSGDQAVDRLSHCPTLAPKRTEVLCGFDGKLFATRIEDLESTKFAQHPGRRTLPVNPLEDFAKN